MPHRVLIVEDHALMRTMMADYVEQLPDITVCGSTRTAEEALEFLPHCAELVLVDISLPSMSGIDLIRMIKDRWPHLKCLVCSGHDEISYVERSLDAGADGYVAKGSPSELAEALRCLRNGDAYLSASLRERVEALPAAPAEGCGPIDPVSDGE